MKKTLWRRLKAKLPQWKRKKNSETLRSGAKGKKKGASMATKIVAGYLLLVAIMAGIGAYTYSGMKETMAHYQTIIAEDHPYMLAIKEINTQIIAQQGAQRAYLLTGDEQYSLRAQLDGNKVREAIAQAKEIAKEEEEQEQLDQVENVHRSFTSLQDEVFAAFDRGEQEQAIRAALVDLDAVHQQVQSNFNVLHGINKRRVDEAQEKANDVAASALKVTLTLVTLGAGLGIVLGVFLARQSVRPLRDLAAAADQIAAGDLSCQIGIRGRDEVAQLAQSFQIMVAELIKIISGVKESVDQVGDHSRQLTTSAQETTRATEQIASSIQEVAKGAGEQVEETVSMTSVVEQMAAAMDQIADHAQSVAASSQESAQLAEQGSVAIENVIEQNNIVNQSMDRLSVLITELGERSGEIGNIVEVISGIADQTNLLALNAAIEAARAGEEGKGFAVVADEVRKLAEQTTEAAKQVAQLIDRTQQDTEQAIETMEISTGEKESGSKLLQSARETLGQIFSTVERVAEQIQEVSAAAEEMAANSDQVVDGTRKVSLIAENTSAGTENIVAATEEQTATMEEITAAATMLAELASGLEQAVARFKLA